MATHPVRSIRGNRWRMGQVKKLIPIILFCIEQRAAAKPKEAQVRVFGLFLLLPRLAPVGLIVRKLVSELVKVLVRSFRGHS